MIKNKSIIIIYIIIIFMKISYSNAGFFEENSYTYNIKGVQIFNINKKYEGRLDSYFRELKLKGVDTVFIRVFQNDGDRYHYNLKSKCQNGVYFKSKSACTINDILPELIVAAKKENIKVFAWMATRSLSFLKNIYGKDSTFNKDGSIIEGYGANIFDNRVRDSIISLFKELAFYNLDGILIQDDFIMKLGEGASQLSLNRFNAYYGEYIDSYRLFDNTSTELKNDWMQWKMEELSSLLSTVKFEVKKINPSILFAVNIYYETPMYPSQGLSWYAQSIEKYNKLNFDYFALMGYQEQIMMETMSDFDYVKKYLDNSIISIKDITKDNSRTLLKLQIRSFVSKKALDNSQILELCNIAYNRKSGIVLLPLEDPSEIPYGCFRQ